MLFHITQVHTPEQCPRDVGGAKALYNDKAEGCKLVALYGAYAEHVVYYIVEADTVEAIYGFLDPGWLRCDATITPVSTVVVPKGGFGRQRGESVRVKIRP